MPFKLQCPRCRQALLVPRKKANSYAHCPRCGGRFWVPSSGPTDPGPEPGEVISTAAEGAEGVPATPPVRMELAERRGQGAAGPMAPGGLPGTSAEAAPPSGGFSSGGLPSPGTPPISPPPLGGGGGGGSLVPPGPPPVGLPSQPTISGGATYTSPGGGMVSPGGSGSLSQAGQAPPGQTMPPSSGMVAGTSVPTQRGVPPGRTSPLPSPPPPPSGGVSSSAPPPPPGAPTGKLSGGAPPVGMSAPPVVPPGGIPPVRGGTSGGVLLPSVPPGQAPPPVLPGVVLPSARPGVVATIPPPAPAGRKVARFIATQAAQSTIPLGADGKLPDLRLKESQEDQAVQEQTRSLNPFVLLVVVCLSVGLSVVLIFVDVSPRNLSLEQKKQKAREIIDAEYTASPEGKEPERYQLYLREALIAHSHGDYRKERQYYQRVLDMLRAERLDPARGLTGSPARDRRLEEQITILLSGPP